MWIKAGKTSAWGIAHALVFWSYSLVWVFYRSKGLRSRAGVFYLGRACWFAI